MMFTIVLFHFVNCTFQNFFKMFFNLPFFVHHAVIDTGGVAGCVSHRLNSSLWRCHILRCVYFHLAILHQTFVIVFSQQA